MSLGQQECLGEFVQSSRQKGSTKFSKFNLIGNELELNEFLKRDSPLMPLSKIQGVFT